MNGERESLETDAETDPGSRSGRDREVAAVLDQLIKATRLELSAARDRGRQKRFELTDGVELQRDGGFITVRLPTAMRLATDEGAVGVAQVQGLSLSAEILAIEDESVTIRIKSEEDLDFAQVTVLVDESWLLELLMESLNEQAEGRRAFNGASAMRLIGKAPTVVSSGSAIRADSVELNSAQAEAIEIATASTPSFIWGPPGTGKTFTLARLVAQLALSNERVLLASNTNVAVDTALAQTVAALADHPAIGSGLVLRIGPIVREDVSRSIGHLVTPELVAARMSAGKLEERLRLANEQEAVAGVAAEVNAERALLKQLADVASHVAQLERRVLGLQGRIGDAEQRRLRLSGQEGLLQSERQKAHRSAVVRAIAGGRSADAIDIELDRVRHQIKQAEHGRLQDEQLLSRASAELLEARGLLPPDVQGSEGITAKAAALDARLVELRAQWRNLQAGIVSIDEALADLRGSIIRNACILFTTAYRAQGALFGDLPPFDTVIIDEASMLPLPLAWIAAGRSSGRVIAAGDFRQLPPIALAGQEDAVQEWYAKDVFSSHRIPSRVEAGDNVPNMAHLNIQYRMPKQIADLISEFAYPQHGLITLEDRPTGSSLSESALVLINSSARGARCEGLNGSRLNAQHALLAAAVVNRLLEAGDVDIRDLTQRVSVITPFRAQAHRIVEELSRTIDPRVARRLVVTVHRMQGNERDFVIFDLVEAPPLSISMLARGSRPSDQGPRLLNVALSRTRRQLVVIAHLDHIIGRSVAGSSYRGHQIQRLAQLMESGFDSIDIR